MGSICCSEKLQTKPILHPKIKRACSFPCSKSVDTAANLTPGACMAASGSLESKTCSLQNLEKRGPHNYQSIRYLGHGAFGSVVLAEQKSTHKQYAMKVIQKSKITEQNLLQTNLMQQLSLSNSLLLVPIKETFQNKNYIYIIMEYLPKGDIYFYLKKEELVFTQRIIADFTAEIIVAVEFLHRAGIVYRQLKPENILVTDEGHIKLTDYGLSKVIIGTDQVHTFIGTLEYMAPEALKGNFGQQADLWSIGVLMYELYFKKNPFEIIDCEIESNPNLHCDRKWELHFQVFDIKEKLNQYIGLISNNFRLVLIGLFDKSPQHRLTIEQLKKHPFYHDIDWDAVAQRKNEGALKELISKNNLIIFRDAIGEQYKRRKYIKNPNTKLYEPQLFQFRNSH